MPRGKHQTHQQQGFTLIAVMAALLLLALTTQGVMVSLSGQAERQRETELKRISAMYAKAIKDYYDASPGSVKQYPTKLEDLLLDKRYVTNRRYLRKLYENPMQPAKGMAAWRLERDQADRITGVTGVTGVLP